MYPASVDTHFATIALVGAPNAGKSTLLNAIVGADLAIMSPKAQSTRAPVTGLRTDGTVQLAVVDPPGLLTPAYLLQEAMLQEAWDAVRNADAVLYLHRVPDGPPPPLDALLPRDVLGARPHATVLTCVDLVPPGSRPAPQPGVFCTNALTGDGVEAVVAWCRSHARPGPFRYDGDDLSAQPMRFFVAEYVREAAFDVLRDEVPYGVAAAVDEFREQSDPVYIRVIVYVERESHKGMLIGAGGKTVKQIGQYARRRAEAILGRHVYLDLWVKVLPRWRRSAEALRQLGFHLPSTRVS